MTRLQLVFDHWFRVDGVAGFSSESNYTPARLRARYLAVFGGVEILGRCSNGKPGDTVAALECSDELTLKVVATRKGPLAALSGAPRLAAAVMSPAQRAAALVIVMPGMLGIVASLAARVVGRPYAVELVGDAEEALRVAGLGRVGVALMAHWVRRVVLHASAVAYVTESQLQQRYPAAAAALTTSYSSIELPDDWVVAKAWENPRSVGRLKLCTVGAMSQPYKGIDVFIESLRLLRGAGWELEVTVIGGGPLQSAYEEQARTAGVDGWIRFTGHVAGPGMVRDELLKHDLYVHPSRTEGLPRSLIEAMATGLPCVATDVGGTRDLLAVEYICPPGDPSALASGIANLLNSPRIAARQAEANLTRARSYTQSRLHPRRRQFYEAVMGTASQRSSESARSARGKF